MDRQAVKLSKFLSKVLRHDPGVIGVTLDDEGWIGVDKLLEAMARHGRRVSRAELEHVVAENDKQRFALRGGRIRANQGHSIDIALGLEPSAPPARLFHGTAKRRLDAVLAEGLRAMSRQHVHLSLDADTARRVGARHGKPVILLVDAGEMHAAGHTFYLSENGVWLTDRVPAAYLAVMGEDG